MACLWDVLRSFKHYDSLGEFMKIFSISFQNFILLSVMELGCLLKILRAFYCHLAVFLRKVSYRTKKYDYLFFDGQLFPEHHEPLF